MKKIVSLLLVLLMVFSLAACAKSTPTPETPKPNEPAPSENADSITVNVGAYPNSIDPALNSAVDGATYIIHAFSGLVGYKQNADGTLELYADAAKELPKAEPTADGKVQYTFE